MSNKEREETPSVSPIAESLERLRHATVEASEKRSRLPQPLFWSLFVEEIRKIRKAKSARRTVDEILGG